MINYKKICLISLLVVGVVLITGCGQTPNGNQNKIDNTGRNFLRNNTSSTDRFFSMGNKGTVADLIVGKQVFVFGTTNQDGTMNALRIMVGEPNGAMIGFASSTTSTGQFRWGEKNPSAPNSSPTPPTGQRFNRENGEEGNNERFRRMGGGTMLRGEIISKDDSSLTIKSRDGGSRIVFYSDKTEISVFQPSTTTSNGINVNILSTSTVN